MGASGPADSISYFSGKGDGLLFPEIKEGSSPKKLQNNIRNIY